MLTRHAHYRRNRNRLLRGRAPRRGGSAPLTLRQQIGQVLGVDPQVFADARELTVGDGNDVPVWGDWVTDPGGALSQLDADGWRSMLPTVRASIFTWFKNETDGVNYALGMPCLWVFSAVFDDKAANRPVVSVESDVDSQPRWDFAITSANKSRVLTRNDAGTLETDDGGDVTVAEPLHYGMVYNGSRLWVAELSASGLATLQSDVPHGPGGVASFNRITLGRATGANGADGDYGLTSMTRCSAGAATLANLQTILNLHNQAYPVA